MAASVNPTTIVDKVAETLVAPHKFTTKEDALWDLAFAAVRNKISYYRRRVRRLENKYGIDFDTFTAQFKNRATPAEEDDWLGWRSARSMLADWQKTYQDLQNEHAR